ncbi:hypothetical protein C8F01DRAFT_698556 [Mycena amicta]|nr:hypothetical protein C8F01DRAFT_698556 [Mycena amicta]
MALKQRILPSLRLFLTITPDSSKGIMTEIATEVYELIMDHLSDDARTLLACNLVCRAWHPRSHHLLLRLMACRPRALSGIVHGGHGTIHCAVPYLQGGVIYGATDGVYLGTENGSRRRLASLRNVVRIAIFQDVNLFLCIADSDLISMPLRPLISAQTNVTRISKHVVYVSVHRSSTPGEHHRVCALKSSALSGTIKVFDVIGDQHGARLAVARVRL